MRLYEETLESNTIYEGKIITLKRDKVKLENGNIAYREVVNHSGGVGVIALNENGEIYMVKQFRYPYKKTILEIPAGKLNKGEDPLECGKRELCEECGVKAKNYISLGEIYPSTGYVDEVIHLYLATSLSKSQQKLDDDEFLDVLILPFEKVVKMVMSGEITDSKTVSAVLKTDYLIKNTDLLK